MNSRPSGANRRLLKGSSLIGSSLPSAARPFSSASSALNPRTMTPSSLCSLWPFSLLRHSQQACTLFAMTHHARLFLLDFELAALLFLVPAERINFFFSDYAAKSPLFPLSLPLVVKLAPAFLHAKAFPRRRLQAGVTPAPVAAFFSNSFGHRTYVLRETIFLALPLTHFLLTSHSLISWELSQSSP